MANFKLVVSDPKTKKAFQKEIDQGQSGLLGKKIGEKLPGNNLGLSGYELEITGGSDRDGFPMRKDVEGAVRKRVLLSFPPGFHPILRGQRKRKTIRGNTISQHISQVNLKVTGHGAKPIEELFGVKEKPEEKKEVKERPERPKEEKPVKEAKEEPKEKPEKTKEKPKEEEKAEKLEKPEEKPKEPEKKEQAKEVKAEEKKQGEVKEPKEAEEKKS